MMYAHMCKHPHPHTQTYMYTHTDIILPYTHACTRHTHTHIHILAHAHRLIHYTHTYTRARAHTHTHLVLLYILHPHILTHAHLQILIFSQFTTMLDILEDYMEMKNIRYSRLDGSMPFADRQIHMTKFKSDPKCMVFLLSTRAAGLGLNLTAADTVIIYDSDWVCLLSV